jgi:drug/metabolite transporter (DMT)-like permease
MSRLQSLRSYLARGGRLPWWWMVGNGLVFLLAILLGNAVEDDHHRGLDFKSLAVGVVVILVGHAILAVAVVLADSRRAQHDEDAPRPRRDR